MQQGRVCFGRHFVSPSCGQTLKNVKNESCPYPVHPLLYANCTFNPRKAKSLRETREYRCLLVSTDALEREQTDRQIDRHTHKTTTIGSIGSIGSFCCRPNAMHTGKNKDKK